MILLAAVMMAQALSLHHQVHNADYEVMNMSEKILVLKNKQTNCFAVIFSLLLPREKVPH